MKKKKKKHKLTKILKNLNNLLLFMMDILWMLKTLQILYKKTALCLLKLLNFYQKSEQLMTPRYYFKIWQEKIL
jgi:hypothetical protein